MSVADDARDAALDFEAVKAAYRQTKEGIAITFVVHPEGVPQPIAMAPLGTRYMIALVEIGDDEQPVSRDPGVTPERRPDEVSADPPRPSPVGAHKNEVAEAGRLARDVIFQQFASEKADLPPSLELAVVVIRAACGVRSRAEIAFSDQAYHAFLALKDEFYIWAGRMPEPR